MKHPPGQGVSVFPEPTNRANGLTRDLQGRVVACEVLVPTPAIRNLIREGKTHQIYSALQTGSAQGMQTMDTSLATLVARMDGQSALAEGQRARIQVETSELHFFDPGTGEAIRD